MAPETSGLKKVSCFCTKAKTLAREIMQRDTGHNYHWNIAQHKQEKTTHKVGKPKSTNELNPSKDL